MILVTYITSYISLLRIGVVMIIHQFEMIIMLIIFVYKNANSVANEKLKLTPEIKVLIT